MEGTRRDESLRTWQALIGVGYRFGWGDLLLTARTLSYNFNDDAVDMRFTGPALAASFRFYGSALTLPLDSAALVSAAIGPHR